jgi:hypothetical protein
VFINLFKTNKMKKLLLMAAFAGLLGSSAVAGTFGDDKGKNKKECKKSAKACAGEKKEGCNKSEKACCKKKAEAAEAATSSETKTDNQQ